MATITENAALNPLTAYAKSKINTELGVQELANEKFVVTCLRFPTACGMSSRVRLDLVLNDFVASALAVGRIDILSDGTPWRPLIDVKDMARAIEWAVRRDPQSGGGFLAVNVGRSDSNYRVHDLAALVQEAMPGVGIAVNRNAQPDQRSYKVDFSQYQSLAPKHLPQVPLSQSIRELRDGLGGIGFSDANFRSSSFIRLKVLTDLRESGAVDEKLRWLDR